MAPTGSDSSIEDQTASAAAGSYCAGAADLTIPVRDELRARLRGEDSAWRRKLRRRIGRRHAVVRRCEPDETIHLFGMLRRVAAGSRTAERPRHEAHPFHAAQRAHVVNGRANVVPVGRNGGHPTRIRRRARRREKRGHERSLPVGGQVAGIVHRRGTRGAAIAGHVHREHIEAGARQVRHPAVVLVWHVEGHFRRRAGAVNEEHDAVSEARVAKRRSGGDTLPHIQLRRLAGNRRHGRLHANVVIDREDLSAVVGDGRGLASGEKRTEQAMQTSMRLMR